MALVVWTILAVGLARELWFFGDDFDFLVNRSISLKGGHGLFVPNNEHWSTVPILIFRLNFALFGMRHYLPYAVLPIACHVLISVLIHALLRRCNVSRWISVLCALVVAFFAGGAGWENPLWDFQIGFLGSCVAGSAALAMLAGAATLRGRILSVTALVLALMSSGIGVLMVFWVGLYLMFRDGLRAALQIILLPALVFIVWYLSYGRGHTGAPAPDFSVAVSAAFRGLASIWTAGRVKPMAGIAIPMAMAVSVVVRRERDGLFPLAASGLVTLVAAYALFAYTRSGFGVDAAMASRYAYFGVVFSVPALATVLQSLSRTVRSWHPWLPNAVGVIGMASTVVIGSSLLMSAVAQRQPALAQNEDRLVAASELAAENVEILRPEVPIFNARIGAAALAKPSVQAAVPPIRPTRRALLDVAAHLQVDVGRSSFDIAPPRFYRWVDGRGHVVARERSSGGCAVRRFTGPGTLEVPLRHRPAQLRLRTAGQPITTMLVSGDVQSEPVTWPTTADVSVFLASTAENATLRVVNPGGSLTVCSGR